ncbi:MAG: hypothetical protein N2489_05145 [Clostridia bacterium]|nr:hypothetical protein [Clostridia bacterium]
MLKMKRTLLIFEIALLFLCFTGCAALSFGKKEGKEANAASQSQNIPAPEISSAEDSEIKALIYDYFVKLYSEKPDYYTSSSISGRIPGNVKGFISKKTLSEADGNPENGIHLPRIIELNGLNLIEYRILKYKDEAGQDKPEIDAAFAGKIIDGFSYNVKIALEGKGLRNGSFMAAYQEDMATRTFTPLANAGINPDDVENIKLLVKYDLTIAKNDEGYKILKAREASNKPGFSHRLSKANNDFAEKLPYLFIDMTLNGRLHVINEHVELYQTESSVIEAFFTALTGLDAERMNLLKSEWSINEARFLDALKKYGLPKSEKLKDKGIEQLIAIDGNYRVNFDYYSLPLQSNMNRITEIKNMNIIPHPGYSKGLKKYIVVFDADSEMASGTISSRQQYRYDYSVDLNDDAGGLKVKRIKLNECFNLEKK